MGRLRLRVEVATPQSYCRILRCSRRKRLIDCVRLLVAADVLFIGHTPSLISGRTILDARVATAADFSWASVASGELPPTPTPPAQPPASPPDLQAVSEAIMHAVSAAVPLPDVMLDKPDTALRYTRRRLKDADVYLFFNEGATPLGHSVTLRSDGKSAESWGRGQVRSFR